MATSSFRSVTVFIVVALAAVLLPAASAGASCAALERQLAGLRASTGSGGTRDRARQREALGDAIWQARSANCGSNGSSQRCRTLLAAVSKLESHLARGGAPAGGKGSGKAARIRADLATRGCKGHTAGVRRGKATMASLQRVPRRQKPKADVMRKDRDAAPSVPAGGTFRTLCVRECDGYFFPISFSTTADRFKNDAEACAARCPETTVALYAHPMPHADVETMVSALDGTPYTDLKTAFLYKLTGPAKTLSCRCGVPKTIQDAVKATNVRARGPEARRAAAIPTPRPDLVAERRIAEARRSSVPSDAADGVGATAERPIRVVGPRFYPD